ncbi:MAG TPA: hypothetical protein VGJ71_07930, partial [Candidatus Limnocylindrales bacterium]
MSASPGPAGPVEGTSDRPSVPAGAPVAVSERRPGPRSRRADHAPARPYINRELAWLDYAGRVLYEAKDDRNPLLDRVNFLTIFASMLDEFFQIRISGLRQQVHAGSTKTSPDGMTAAEQLAACRLRVLDLVTEHTSAWVNVKSELAAAGIEIVRYTSILEHHENLRQRFIDEIYPVLTPLAVDPGHPFPYISSMSLNLAVSLRNPVSGERRFARVKVPPILPRFVVMP